MKTTPRLVVFAGLPGSGKSTIGREVARRLGAVFLRVDTVEAALLQAGLTRSFETGLAAYVVARDLARENLREGTEVVVDAVNGVGEARAMWRELSDELGVARYTVHVICSDPEEHRRRVESRVPYAPPLPLPTWEEVIHREFQPWQEKVLTVDSVLSPAENAVLVLTYCSQNPPERRGA
ncbi:MAG: AAA family ATPase [Thermoplasmata archaeon]